VLLFFVVEVVFLLFDVASTVVGAAAVSFEVDSSEGEVVSRLTA
jgi:hypothetical protein